MDLLRILASVGVVVFHYRVYASEWAQHAMVWTGAFHLFVDLFFTISGIIIAHVYSNKVSTLKEFIVFFRRRVARVAPLHWATLGFFILMVVALKVVGISPDDPGRYRAECIVPNILMIHSTGICGAQLSFNYASWSISAEMFMYAIFPIIAFVGRRSSIVLYAIVVALWIALSIYPDALPWHMWTAKGGVLRAAPAFILGVALYSSRAQLSKIPFAGGLMFLFLAAFCILAILGASGAALLPFMYAIAALGLAADGRGVSKCVRSFAPLGQLTYSVYMLHPVVQAVALTLCIDKILKLDGPLRDAAVCLSVVVLFFVSYVSLFWFELPARKALAGPSSKRS